MSDVLVFIHIPTYTICTIIMYINVFSEEFSYLVPSSKFAKTIRRYPKYIPHIKSQVQVTHPSDVKYRQTFENQIPSLPAFATTDTHLRA